MGNRSFAGSKRRLYMQKCCMYILLLFDNLHILACAIHANPLVVLFCIRVLLVNKGYLCYKDSVLCFLVTSVKWTNCPG